VASRVLNISRSGYYDWLGRPEPPRELRNKELTKMIREIHAGSRGSYGLSAVTLLSRGVAHVIDQGLAWFCSTGWPPFLSW